MMTSVGIEIDDTLALNFSQGLVGRFFKIIPLKEGGRDTLCQYLKSLQRDMLGAKELICVFKSDDKYCQLLCILQYLIDNDDVELSVVRSDVFRAISIIKKLQEKYFVIEER